MATITIRNIPKDVVERIKIKAKNNGHSMEQEVRELINQHYVNREEILKRIEERWAKLPKASKEELDSWRNIGRD